MRVIIFYFIILFVLPFNYASSQLIFSTYLGGYYDDDIVDVKVDSAGNSFITGMTFSRNFPVTEGCYDSLYIYCPIIVAKFNNDGSKLLFSTFIGGEKFGTGGYVDYSYNLAIDNFGNSYITGYTGTGKFPTTANAFDTIHSRRGFVTKFNQSGTAILYSSLIGYLYLNSAFGYGIAVDTTCNIYITGITKDHFPVTAGAYDITYNGNANGNDDIYVFKLNYPDYSFNFSTYLGGDYCEGFYYSWSCHPISLEQNNNIIISGWTTSYNFPITKDAYDSKFERQTDPKFCEFNKNKFITKFNPSGSALIYSTFIPGDSLFQSFFTADKTGNAYITGCTSSTTYPTTEGAYSRTENDGGKINDCFISKLNPLGTDLIFSTYLGGDSSDIPFAGIAINSNSDIFISGITNSTNFPIIKNIFDSTSKQFFFTEINSLGSSIIFSSYLKLFDPRQFSLNNFNQATFIGSAYNDLATTHGAFDETYNGIAHGINPHTGLPSAYDYDGFIMKLMPCAGSEDFEKIKSIDFGRDVCNRLDTFYIKNPGQCVLDITNCKITGANAGLFSLVSPESFIVSIMPGDSVPFIVQFNADSNHGDKSATMSLNYYNQTSPWNIDLKANNLLSKIQSDSLINFVPVFCNSNGIDTFYVKSAGSCDVEIDSIYLTGLSASRFTIIEPHVFPQYINKGDSLRFIIIFYPNSTSAQTANLVLRNNSTTNPWIINISALKIFNDITIDGNKSDTIIIDLGIICPGFDKDTTITIQNKLPAISPINFENIDPELELNVTDKSEKKEGETPLFSQKKKKK